MQTNPLPQGGAREFHIRDYWRILWQGRYTVLAIFLVTVTLTAVRAWFATPIYRATAVIEIKPEARRILPGQEQWLGAEGAGWLSEEKYFTTQLEVLKSRDVAEKTFRRLHLDRHPDFEGLRDPVGAFAGRIFVTSRVNTRLVNLSVEGKDPKQVREWVDTLADVYVRRNVDQALASFQGIMDEIQRGLATTRTDIGQADQKKLQLAVDADLYIPENQQDILKQTLETYNAQVAKTRVDLAALASEIESLDGLRGDGGNVLALPRIQQDPVVQDLVSRKLELERDLARLTEEKKARHPEVLAKRNELEQVEGKVGSEIDRIAEKLRTEYRLARAGEANLLAQIRRTEEQAYRVKQASSSYEIQKTAAESKRKVYDVVSETMERLAVGAQLISMNNNVSILDRAIEPRAPVKPRRMLSLALGAALGLALGIGAVLFLDYLDNTLRTPEDVEQYLGLGVVGIVPKYREKTEPAVREAFQSLRTSVLFSSQNRQKKVLMLTSAGPQEGKSSTVHLLGRALASAGDRVVILDCDLRRPTQHLHAGTTREPGLTNYLLDGQAGEWSHTLRATDLPSLAVLTCGPIPPNAPDVIGMAKFHDLLRELKRAYDWVLLDSPPVASLADAIMLAPLVDAVLLVVKHNQNDRDLVRRSLKRLRDVNASVIGAILNNVDLGRAFRGDYYYAGYEYAAVAEGKRGRRRPGVDREKGADGRGDGKVAL